MNSSDYPVLDLERSFPPELLRQLPSRALLVPRLMQVLGGKGQLYRRTNGRGDPYSELRLSPNISAGRSSPCTLYIGPLTPDQESLLSKLVDEFNDQRPRDSIEQLHQFQLLLEQSEEFRLDAKDIADACAQAIGYRLHGYLVKKKPNQDALSEIALGRTSSIKEVDPWARETMTYLIALRNQAFSNPEQAFVNALFVLQLISEREIAIIDTMLRQSALGRIAQLTASGSCRRLSKIETRMLSRKNKASRILRKVEKSMGKVRHLVRSVEMAG